jgi:glutathione synthase/RimK-type ligase-like ATP-grasp enzyme
VKILVITSGIDPHIEMVKKHLPSSDFVIFDPVKLLNTSEISYKWNNNKYEIFNNDTKLNDCDVVWFRKPIILEPEQLPVEKKYQKFVHGAYKRTANAIYALLRDKYWVSDPWAIIRANNKLLQQEIAAENGLLIPDTLITNSPDEARKFQFKYPKIITKPLGAETVIENDLEKAFYVTTIIEDENIDYSGLKLAPAIFQQNLVGNLDIRVTVVGKRVHACEIHKNGSLRNRPDWRIGILSENLEYKNHTEFPKTISDKCVSIIKALNLKFGAFDFMLDNRGDYWFLEVNPNGQWGFVELEANIPISGSFAELFTEKYF